MSSQAALPFSVQALPMFLFLSVAVISLFSFVGVAVWSDARRRERDAYYKNDMLKKMAETQGTGVEAALEMMWEQDRIASRHRREGIRLGGLVTSATGIGLLIFLRVFRSDQPVYLCGLIPLFIGVALLAYSYVLAPKQ
jgi:hypothetical protein